MSSQNSSSPDSIPQSTEEANNTGASYLEKIAGTTLSDKAESAMKSNDADRLQRDQPFPDAQTAREAIRAFSRPKTELYELEAIKNRLLLSGIDLCQNITRLLLDNFDNLIYDGQRVTFELTEHNLAHSSDVSRLIMPLAVLVGNRDEAVRQRSTKLLCSIGPLAKPAEDIAMGCLRNNDATIRLSGAKILYAIGSSCSRSITRQLRTATQRYSAEREFCALLIGTVKRITAANGAAVPVGEQIEEERPASESGRLTAVLSKLLFGKTALVVEDNDVLLTTISEMLSGNLRMNALRAESGQQGMEAIDAQARAGQPLDYVILDLKMNGVNGLQVLKRLKEHAAFADTIVVVISGVKDERISEVVLGTGAHAFLPKPFRLAQLVKTMVSARATRANA